MYKCLNISYALACKNKGLKKSKMKKRVGISILVAVIIIAAAILFLRGGITGNVVKDTCTSPYIYIGGNCCLDENDNKICDSDENPSTYIRAVDAKDECVIDRRFTCTWKKISNNLIQIRLRNDKSGIFSPTSIEFSGVGKNGCKKTFSGTVEYGFDYQKSEEYSIECDFSENYINSLITIKGMTYERNSIKGPSLMPYTIWEFETEGHISGFVE